MKKVQRLSLLLLIMLITFSACSYHSNDASPEAKDVAESSHDFAKQHLEKDYLSVQYIKNHPMNYALTENQQNQLYQLLSNMKIQKIPEKDWLKSAINPAYAIRYNHTADVIYFVENNSTTGGPYPYFFIDGNKNHEQYYTTVSFEEIAAILKADES